MIALILGSLLLTAVVVTIITLCSLLREAWSKQSNRRAFDGSRLQRIVPFRASK